MEISNVFDDDNSLNRSFDGSLAEEDVLLLSEHIASVKLQAEENVGFFGLHAMLLLLSFCSLRHINFAQNYSR